MINNFGSFSERKFRGKNFLDKISGLESRVKAIQRAENSIDASALEGTVGNFAVELDGVMRAGDLGDGQMMAAADAIEINWWLPLTLADDAVNYIMCSSFKTIGGIKYLYVGGMFTRIGGVDAVNIARYNFSTRGWEAVNGGVGGTAYVYCIAWSPADVLYIGGYFSNAGGDVLADGIAKDNGAGAWVNVNGGVAGGLATVACIAWDAAGVLHIGGVFLNAGGDALADYIAKDDGAGSWVNVNGGLPAGSQCLTMAWDAAGVLHIGGDFDNASGVALADNIARDDGAGAWEAVNGGLVNDYVEKIVFDAENNLYICGGFTAAGADVLTTYIAKGVAGAWVNVGGGLNARCRNMAFDNDGNLMACGDFTNASGDATADRVAWFDGANWYGFSNGGGLEGISGYVWTLVMDTNGSLYAGGLYSTAGTIQCESLACFVRPLSDAIDMIAGLFEQYQAREAAIRAGLAGTYTPTLYNTTNVAASTAYQCQYMRVGNVVTVSGQVNVDPTTTGAVLLGLSLPIASNLGAYYHLGGTAVAGAVAGQCAAIYADAANDRASFAWIAVDVANRAWFFTFTYLVI